MANELEELGVLHAAHEDIDILDFQSGQARTYRIPQDRGIEKLIRERSLKEPSICLYLSPADEPDSALEFATETAVDRGHVVLPIARTREDWSDAVPEILHDHNVGFWEEPEERRRIVRTVVDELGFGERDRRVFISYRREDGTEMAEQLYKELTAHGFDAFLDQFDVRRGEIVQEEIERAIDKAGFLLVLESPKAHESEWIEREVTAAMRFDDYPLLALTWPNTDTPIATLTPDSDLRRHLDESELEGSRGERKLTEQALSTIVDEVYREHSIAIGTRRRNMVGNIVDAGEDEGWAATKTGRGTVLLQRGDPDEADQSWLVGVSPRTPQPVAHYRLNKQVLANDLREPDHKYLVHTARAMTEKQARLNNWAIEPRAQEEMPLQDFLERGYL